jgi:hypothetical protein
MSFRHKEGNTLDIKVPPLIQGSKRHSGSSSAGKVAEGLPDAFGAGGTDPQVDRQGLA